jgi:CxxC motif-containing protein
MKRREMVCIACPNGCQLTVESTSKGLVVKGNTCPKGEAYALEEVRDPRRVVTAVVRTTSPQWPCVPVRTVEAVPKALIARLLRSIYRRQVHLPVRRGTKLIEDFGGAGVDVVFTRTVPPMGKGDR